MPSAVQSVAERLCRYVEIVLVGKHSTVQLAVVALLCEGHLLLEDVPGIGKTTLARALASSIGGTFRRLQCTPDLLPSDVTGVSVFDQRTADFVFRPGPIFANVLLADEINRATPRTQSAVLEAMQEAQVSADGVTRPLPRPYVVLATQNPVELEGTFPLPEAQLDRFLLRVRVGYPSEEEEQVILHRFKNDEPLEALQPMVSAEQVLALQRAIRQVAWQPEVERYLLAIVRATREHPAVTLGVSPRGTLALYRACEAFAAMQGRDYVQPDDVKRLAPSVLAHRLLTTTRARLRGSAAEAIITEIVASVPVPVETISLPQKR